MTTPAELYTDGIKKKLKNYYAAWLPGTDLELGDVGVLEGNIFTKLTSLKNLGISFKKRPDRATTGKIEYVSESGVSRIFKAAGENNTTLINIPQGKAGIGVKFSEKGAFIVEAQESYELSIDDIEKLEEDIREAYQQGKWKSKYTVIVRLIHSPCTTIMISNSSKASIQLSIEGDVPINGISLANAGGVLAVKSEEGDILKFIDAKELTLFFQLVQVKAKPFVWDFFNLQLPESKVKPLDIITPVVARENPKIASSLYLDLVRDSEVQ
jgi:hypothetical protein